VCACVSLIEGTCCVYFVVHFQNVDLCPPCYEEFGHEHAVRKYIADSESRTATKSGVPTSNVIQRCIETVAHSAACTLGAECPRQPECKKMMDVLRHARACTLRTSCTVCQQLMALCVTHARGCTTDSSACHVPFCAELRRHIQRRQTLQRQQQHRMDDRRRALMTGAVASNEDFIQTVDRVEIHPGDIDSGQQRTGKGGDRPELPISSDVSATESSPANVTVDEVHLTTNAAVLHQNNNAVCADNAESLTSASGELKTSRCPASQMTSDLTSNCSNSFIQSSSLSVPTAAASGIGESLLLEHQSDADDVLQTTESSARHQIVVDCLRVLKKLNPSMSKQNLLQLLCHCSRQQLTALQDKVNSFFLKFIFHLYVLLL